MQDPIKRDTFPDKPTQRDAGTWFALAGMVGIALVAVLALVVSSHEPKGGDALALANAPSTAMIDQCNAHASQARESAQVADASDVTDDDPNLAGINDENRYSSAARAAYRDCMLGIREGS
jgi:hypothetical protein